MNLNDGAMTAAAFDRALTAALTGELLTDTGAPEAVQELLEQIADAAPAERQRLAADARAAFRSETSSA